MDQRKTVRVDFMKFAAARLSQKFPPVKLDGAFFLFFVVGLALRWHRPSQQHSWKTVSV